MLFAFPPAIDNGRDNRTQSQTQRDYEANDLFNLSGGTVTKAPNRGPQPTAGRRNAQFEAWAQDDSLFARIQERFNELPLSLKVLAALTSPLTIPVGLMGLGILWLGSKIAGLAGGRNADMEIGEIQAVRHGDEPMGDRRQPVQNNTASVRTTFTADSLMDEFKVQ